jgi:hypothetical protein
VDAHARTAKHERRDPDLADLGPGRMQGRRDQPAQAKLLGIDCRAASGHEHWHQQAKKTKPKTKPGHAATIVEPARHVPKRDGRDHPLRGVAAAFIFPFIPAHDPAGEPVFAPRIQET